MRAQVQVWTRCQSKFQLSKAVKQLRCRVGHMQDFTAEEKV